MFLNSNDNIPVSFFVTEHIHLYINENLKEVIDKEGSPIMSDTIVEFIYDSNNT